MANVIFSLRIPEELKESLEATAKEKGVSVSDLIRDRMMVTPELAAPVRRMVEEHCEKLGLTTQEFVEAVLVRRMAERVARNKVWGTTPEMLPEFARVDGNLMRGDELFSYLVDTLTRDEEQKMERDLLEREARGCPLSPKGVAFLKSRRKGRAWYESEEFKALSAKMSAMQDRVDTARAAGIVPHDYDGDPELACKLLDIYEHGGCTANDLHEMLGDTRGGWVSDENEEE